MTRSQQSLPQNQQEQDPQSKILNELSSLVMNVIRSPPRSLDLVDDGSPATATNRRSGPSFEQMTPAGFACLLLGMSLGLMLCGSVTFFIGFMLMPWVLGLLVILYFLGLASCVSTIGKAVLCYGTGLTSPRKEVPSWKLL